jgi:hypothetical protein
MRVFYKYSLTIVLHFAFLYPVAQKSKDPKGYIVTLNNDTLPCVFKARSWKKQPGKINLKLAEKDTSFTPQSISGFIIPSLQIEYMSRIISPVKYIDKLQNATTLKQPEVVPAQASFLRVLHRGTFILSLYLDDLSRKHFFVEAPDNLVELYSHYYLDPGDSRRIYDQPIAVLDKAFEFVLKTLMTPCRTIFSIIENIELNEESLKAVFDIYDKCMISKRTQTEN